MKEIEIEINGEKIKAQENDNLLDLSLKNGKYIPHFCYHKKLSIAANCRMCLVEIEKSPKPIPACTTKVTNGMKIFTNSKLAVEAQKGVMEFLLINHPLDCPICDQGGECQLQDLSLDYGKDATRFRETKRVVKDENLGSLIETHMTRCIHCSRCVRFTDEIAGYQELGMYYRNNHVRVMSFLERSIDSEISGNVIDLCPVGALTSKPFLFKDRSWELSRRKSISSHDSFGSNLIVNIDKYYKVVRVLPLENETINECWLSDRDRFAYNGLYHQQRISTPLIKQNGKWIEVSWQIAIEYVAKTIYQLIQDHGSNNIGVIANPNSTMEELYLLKKLMINLDIKNLDHRINQIDFLNNQNSEQKINYLGNDISLLSKADHILLLSTNLRNEQPLLAQKLRQTTKQDTIVDSISNIDENFLFKTENNILINIDFLKSYLLGLLSLACKITNKNLIIENSIFFDDYKQYEAEMSSIINNLLKENSYILFGKIIESLSDYSDIVNILKHLAKVTGATIGLIPSYANSVGASIINFLPYNQNEHQQQNTDLITDNDGFNIKQMLEKKLKSYLLFNIELEQEYPNKDLVFNSLKSALSVIVFSPYYNQYMLDYADILLPIATSYETAGSFVNCAGTMQYFNGCTKPYLSARPAWKLIRVLANQFGFNDFTQDDINQVRQEMKDEITNNYKDKLISFSTNLLTSLDNKLMLTKSLQNIKNQDNKITLLVINNIYNNDMIVRRSKPLQQTELAKQICIIGFDLANQYKLINNKEHQIKINNQDTLEVIIKINKRMPTNYAYLMKNYNDDILIDNITTVEF